MIIEKKEGLKEGRGSLLECIRRQNAVPGMEFFSLRNQEERKKVLILQIKNVTKTFIGKDNQVEALKGISLDINKGDISLIHTHRIPDFVKSMMRQYDYYGYL